MSGRQEYREFRPVELYDVAAVESWLEERDREGYHLLRFRGLYGIFYQDCSVAPSRFRLQPLQRWKEALDPERVEAYRSMGWRLVGQLGPFWVWRCDDPNAPELDTDPVVQGEGYRYLKRRMIFRTVGGGLIWLAMTAYFILAAVEDSDGGRPAGEAQAIPPSAAAGTAGVGRCTGHICAESGGHHSESGRQSLWLGPCGADGL